MTATLYRYTARAEFSGTLDLIRTAAAIVAWSVSQQKHKLGVSSIKAGADMFECAEMELFSTMPKEEVLAVMRKVMTAEACPDCHRVYQTLNYTDQYTGDVINKEDD